MSIFLDDPAKPEEDALGRTALARSIYGLIKQSPAEWTLRIGVYGRWGEGKTTLLDAISNLAQQDGLPVARFSPSSASDATQLWNQFFLAIADAFNEESDVLAARSFSERAQRLRARIASNKGVGAFFKAAEPAHPIAGPLFRIAELGSDTLRAQVGLSAKTIDALVRTKAGTKRLVVFVDDVDRVEPRLVPRLLLALRELNVQLTAFVVAVDPDIVTQGLSEVHPGWKDAPEFLEKILQFHYWLPQLDSHTVSKFARLQIPATKLNIPADVIEQLASSLPRNPRKLKEFFRSLWQLTAVITRHEPSDVDWALLLLLELMRAEAPLLVSELLRSRTFRESLAISTFYAKTSDENEKNRSVENVVKRVEDVVGDHIQPQRKERLLRIIERIGEVPLTTEDRIEYWANIREHPPALTSKEAVTILGCWREKQTATRLRELLVGHVAATATTADEAASHLFRKLVEQREARLSDASNSTGLHELQDHVKGADVILELLLMMMRDLHLFGVDSQESGATDFIKLYEHLSHWAHFTNTPEYIAARKHEREVLLEGASLARAIAAPILGSLRFSDRFAETDLQAEAQLLRRLVVSVMLPFVIEDVRGRFERPEGISSLRAVDAQVHHYLLMSPTAGVYSDEFIERLRVLAIDARSSVAVQKNLIEVFRAMASSYSGAGGGDADANQRLQKAAQFLPHIWTGAVASPVQPRLVGDLRQDLDRVNATFARFGVQLAVPTWWREHTSPV